MTTKTLITNQKLTKQGNVTLLVNNWKTWKRYKKSYLHLMLCK